MAFMFRHTTANKTTVPLFLTLFGAGHADYQNRVTSTPIRIPVYEFGRGFVDDVAAVLQRREKISVSVTEQQLYLNVSNQTFNTTVREHHFTA